MKYKFILSLCVLLGLAACGFGRDSAPARFYALNTPTVTQVRGPAHVVNVGIENVSVPQSVDRPQIVIKYANSNMLNVSEFDRWIEGLNNSIAVIISENINTYTKNINARPIRNAAQTHYVKYLVNIDFVRFDVEQDGDITMAAWWTLTDVTGDVLINRKIIKVAPCPESESGRPNYDAIVAAQSKMLAQISYAIADAISELK